MDFGPYFAISLMGGAVYALYLIVPIIAYLLWRRGRAVWAGALCALWMLGAVFVPLADYMRARLQANSDWSYHVLPDAFPVSGKSFLSDDSIRTPHVALQRFNDVGPMYGLYARDDTVAAMLAEPVDLGNLRFFEDVPAPGQYRDSRQVEVPEGTRIAPDYIMLSDFFGASRDLTPLMRHPDGRSLPADLRPEFVILKVGDPAAFDIRTAEVVMLVPYAAERYFLPPFNPFARATYRAMPYEARMSVLKSYFCAGLDAATLDRCRRDI